MTPILDWRPRHDEESKNYPVRTLLPEKATPKRKFWREGTVLDQGSEGACVGFGWTGHLLTTPLGGRPVQAKGNAYALGVYKEAQKIDEWPGEEYSGTSVLAGAKILQQKGMIGSYRWAFGIEDIRDTVANLSPVVIGIPWLDGMYYTRPSGLVEVTGPEVGGHCILLTGYDPNKYIEGKRQEVFRWRNSWGKAYGINGSGYIKYDDLANLISQTGEACIPVGKKALKL